MDVDDVTRRRFRRLGAKNEEAATTEERTKDGGEGRIGLGSAAGIVNSE